LSSAQWKRAPIGVGKSQKSKKGKTKKALALAEQLIESLRSHRVIVPTVTMIDTGNRKIAYLE
jgi:hypothetical protein